MNPPLYFVIGHNQTQIQGRISNIIYLVPSLKQAKKKTQWKSKLFGKDWIFHAIFCV